jgi:acetoin utilization protein AcuB
MNKEVISLKKDVSVREAIELMIKQNTSDMPVVEDDNTLIGTLSEKDALLFLHASEDSIDKTVNDFLAGPPLDFDENENLISISSFLAKNVFRTVPITSQGKLVGTISPADIFKHILSPQRRWPTGEKCNAET